MHANFRLVWNRTKSPKWKLAWFQSAELSDKSSDENNLQTKKVFSIKPWNWVLRFTICNNPVTIQALAPSVYNGNGYLNENQKDALEEIKRKRQICKYPQMWNEEGNDESWTNYTHWVYRRIVNLPNFKILIILKNASH